MFKHSEIYRRGKNDDKVSGIVKTIEYTINFFFLNKVANFVTNATHLSLLAWTVLELIYFIMFPSKQFLMDYGYSFFAIFYVFMIMAVHHVQKGERDEMESFINENFWNLECCGSEFYENLAVQARRAKLFAWMQFSLALISGLLFWPHESDRLDLFFVLMFLDKHYKSFYQYYKYAFFSLLSWGTLIVLTYVNIYIFFIAQLNFQYQLLTKHVEDIEMGFENDNSSDQYHEEIRMRLNICASHFQRLTKFRFLFSKFVYWTFFFVVWVGLGVSMFLAYHLIVMQNYENVIALSFLWFMVAEITVTVAVLSQHYIDLSENFFRTLTKCDWYHWSKSNKKTFLLFMMYSQKYIFITVGGVLVFDISIMVWMAQRTISALTFLQAVRRKNNMQQM